MVQAESRYAGTLTRDSAWRKNLFGERAMTHPAKQHIPQLMDLLQRYSVPGGVLVDPFGGTGTIMLGASPQFGGMYVLSCELESHFLAIEEEAWDYFAQSFYMRPELYPDTASGMYWPMQGDSRHLSAVIAAHVESAAPYADLIITSPSYGGSEAVDRRDKQNGTILQNGGGNATRKAYTGGLKSGAAPHAGSVPAVGYTQIPRMRDIGVGFGKHSQLSAAQLGYVDTIITSPPYQDAFNKGHDQRAELMKAKLAAGEAVFKDMGKVGTHSGVMLGGYGVAAENIGNQQGKKYLASMREIWQECATVLKPGGILCCITRDCIKQQQIVPVGQQNRELLTEAGLTLVDIHTWKIPTLSFWRNTYHQNHPEVPIIDTEEVSVFTKKGADHA